MENKKALEIIKACLDEAVKKGICPTLDVASTLFYAYETIKNIIKDDRNTDTGS